MVDPWGIDWWDVLSLEIAPEVQQFMLIHRLSKKLSSNCELYSSRPHSLATALRDFSARIDDLGKPRPVGHSRARRLSQIFSRSRLCASLSRCWQTSSMPRTPFDTTSPAAGNRRDSLSILLPSAYVNVSRTVLSYAELFPDQKFLLVHTRRNAKVKSRRQMFARHH